MEATFLWCMRERLVLFVLQRSHLLQAINGTKPDCILSDSSVQRKVVRLANESQYRYKMRPRTIEFIVITEPWRFYSATQNFHTISRFSFSPHAVSVTEVTELRVKCSIIIIIVIHDRKTIFHCHTLCVISWPNGHRLLSQL